MNPPCRSLKLNSIHLLIFGILCAPQAIAEDKKTTSLDTIVVTADRNEKSIWDSNLSISAVNAEEISKQNGDSIAETLRDIPGVEITDNSMAGRKQISIRGEAPSRMLILIDGQEVSYHRSGHGSSAGLLIDMESVERIEVIKGPHSVLYGSQAIGGVVNFITRKGSTEHKNFAGHLKTVYNGATNGFTGQGSVYGSIEDFDYRLSGSYSDQGDRKTKEGRLKDTGFDNKSGSAWFGYKINQHKFGLSLEHYNVDTNTYYAYNPREPEIKEFSVKIPKLTRDKVGFFYDYDMGGIIDKIHFDTYYQKLDREFRNNILVAPAPMMAIRTATETNDTQDSLGMTLQANIIPHKDMSLITGIQYQQDVVDQTSHTKNRINTPIPVMDYVSDKNSKNKWQQSSISLFAQNDWQFAKDFNWNLGIRQYWIESKVKNGHSLTTKTPTVGAITYTSQTDKPRSDSHNNIVISTGLTYNGFKDTILRASFGQGYVYPTLAHLYSITSAHQQTIYGNPDLKAEKSNNYELGLRYNNNTWVVDSSLYYSTAKNYITDMICNGSSICSGATSSTTRYYENANKAKTYGAELSVEYVNWDIIPYIKGNYIRRQIETDTYTTYQTGTPTFMATTGLKNTHFFEHFDLDSDLFIRAATHSKNYSGSTVYYYGGWSTLNLSLVASFGQQKQYQLGFDLNNILNKNYTTARESIPAAKINAVISASMKF